MYKRGLNVRLPLQSTEQNPTMRWFYFALFLALAATATAAVTGRRSSPRRSAINCFSGHLSSAPLKVLDTVPDFINPNPNQRVKEELDKKVRNFMI